LKSSFLIVISISIPIIQNLIISLSNIIDVKTRKTLLLLLQPKCIPGFEGRWLGATDITTEGKFIWESGRPFTYHNWSQPGPDNSEGIENCAVMYCNHGQWNDLNCGNNM
jgi:hypothetical protein